MAAARRALLLHAWCTFGTLACQSRGEPAQVVPRAEAGSALADAARQAGPVNAIGMRNTSIAAVVNPSGLPAYSGPRGVVEGIVVVRGPDAPETANLDVHACPAALDTYGKLFRAGPRRSDGARPLADAVVVVTGYAGYYLPELEEAQRVTIGPNCAYPSRTIALTFGQRLEIANDSPIAFGPTIEGGSQLSVMIAAPLGRGEPVKIFPPRADYFLMGDKLQKFVRGELYVLRQPLHAVTDAAGHFRIERVPVGRLQVGARLASLAGDAVVPVDVKADAPSQVELVLTFSPTAAGSVR